MTKGTNTGNRVRSLLDPFNPLPLECDGFTRIASYVLEKAGIAHRTMVGSVMTKRGTVSIHFWIEVEDWIVDYRLRMNAGNDMPHGVFVPPETIQYRGEASWLACDEWLFKVLTSERAVM
jgi:hypothetical protein